MRLPLIFLLLVPFVLRAASPAFTDFDTNQFGTNGNKVEIKSGASITNAALTTPSLGAATALTINTGQGANDLFPMDQGVLTTSSPTFPGMTLSPNGLLNIVWTNLATTPLAAITLSNATPATAGVTVQVSPAMEWTGHAWDTGGSNIVATFRSYVLPVSAATPTATWVLDSSVGDLPFGFGLSISSAGALSSWGSINIAGITSGTITSGASGGFIVNGRSKLVSSVDGAFEFNNNASSARSTAQFNLPQTTKTANWTNAVAMDSGLRFANIGAVIAITNFLQTAVANQRQSYVVDAAQIMSIKAAAGDVIHNAGTPTSSGGDIWSGTQWSTLTIFCVRAGHWVVEAINGTWASN